LGILYIVNVGVIMKLFLTITSILFLAILTSWAEDTAKAESVIKVYSFLELQHDDILTRKVYSPFKVLKGDSVVISVGEMYDKPAEIVLPTGKYLFQFERGEKRLEIEVFVPPGFSTVNVNEMTCREKK
jgi:hypothetical protein